MTKEEEQGAIMLNLGGGGGGSVPISTPQDRADILRSISPDRHPEILRKRFLGEYEENGQIKRIALPEVCKLSEVGAWDLTTSLLGFGSIGTSISKLDDREIKNRLYRITKEALYKSLARWRIYNINDVSMFYTIKEITFTQALTILKQADDASIQELLKGVVHEQRSFTGEVKKEGRLRRMASSLMGK